MRLRWIPLVAVGAALLGCGAAPAPSSPAPPPQVVALPPDPPGASSAAPASEPNKPAGPPRLPPAIALPGELACALKTSRWRGVKDDTALLLRPGGPAFIRGEHPEGRLSIPVGPKTSVVLEMEDGGLVVRGHIDPAAFELRAAKPFVLSGIAVPTMFARLDWIDARAGELTVTHETPRGLELLDPPLRARRPCEDVGLDTASFDPETAVAAGPGKRRRMALSPGATVPLVTEPGASPAANLNDSPRDPIIVEEIETRGQLSRVLWSVDTLLVFGWVSTARLTSNVPPGSGYGSGRGRTPWGSPRWPLVAKVVCEAEVPLYAEANGMRATVGLVRKGTPIEVIQRSGEEAVVWVRTKTIHTLDRERSSPLRARIADIDACKPEGKKP
jgi:hypothetical protein